MVSESSLILFICIMHDLIFLAQALYAPNVSDISRGVHLTTPGISKAASKFAFLFPLFFFVCVL